MCPLCVNKLSHATASAIQRATSMALGPTLVAGVLLLLLSPCSGDAPLRFPDSFLFGASTAAYQVEGAWNADGKSASIWDDLMHQRPELFAGNETSDVAADSYHQFEQDIAALRETGVSVCRPTAKSVCSNPSTVRALDLKCSYFTTR